MNELNATIEIHSRTDLERQQSARLAALLAEVLPRNRFWRAKFAQAGVAPGAIRTPQDLQRLPFTSKAEILADQAAHPPYGTNLTYDLSRYSRLHQTSGTTGVPLRWLDTPQSWDAILGNWRQLFGLMGLRPDDRLFFPFSFGPFLGFWAGFEGANRLGNLCIAAGGMSSLARLNLLVENQATIVCCTPTYALRLAEVAAEQKIDIAASPVRAILVAGEPGGSIPATRRRIEAAWGAHVVDHWGMTELGPLAIESLDEPGGLYVLETECIAEIVDPQTGLPVAPGSEGELIITNLGRHGSPLIRYRTGDLVRAGAPPVAAVKHPRRPLSRGGQRAAHDDVNATPSVLRPHLLYLPGGILCRTDDMISIRGNNLYPSALEDVIRGYDAVAEFRIELRTVKAMQHIKVEIEPTPALAPNAVAQLVVQIADTIKGRWHFQADVVAVASGSLPRFEMKGRRFFRL
jgi:phenylacetate-CoA ligase